MLAERLLVHDVVDGATVPRYLDASDHAWLASLIELASRREHATRGALLSEMGETILRSAPRDAVRLALHVLLAESVDGTPAGLPPSRARREVWAERARSSASRSEVLAAVAPRLGVTPEALEGALVADRRSERRVGRLPDGMSTLDWMHRVNLRLAQGFVARSQGVMLEMRGNVRRVVQHARWQGLLCTVLGDDPARCRIEVSGPFAVLRTTSLYARALAGLVPLLPGCGRFQLQARCRVGGRDLPFRLDDGDPIERGREPKAHDSRLEAMFEADLRRLAPDWDVVREPQALAVAGTLVFPDFAIGPRSDPPSRVLVEIAGWWTPQYLATKLARLRQARCERLIVCVDERLGAVADAASCADLAVIPFRRRVDAAAVLERAWAWLGRPSALSPRTSRSSR